MAKKQVKIETFGRHKCTHCGEWLDETSFYKSAHKFNKSTGLLLVCKPCISEEYEKLFEIYNSERTAVYKLLAELNLPFYQKVYEGAAITAQKKNTKTYQAYFSKLNSFGETNGYGTTFEEGELSTGDVKFEGLNEKNNLGEDYIDEDFEVTSDMIGFWGNGYSKLDYFYLTNDFSRLISSYECESYAQETLFRDIALQNLTIKKKRESGEDVNKDLEMRNKLLGDANIKPNQESGANVTEQATLGLLIKKWENEDPIPEPDPEWKDVDGIGKYIRVWFLGHLCKILGIVNEYSQEYEEEMSRFRVNLPSDNSFVDELEEGE